MGKSASVPHGLSHPVRKAAPRRSGHGLLYALGGGAAIAAALAAWVLWPAATAKTDPTDTLLDQMHHAAAGNVAPTHAFGGSLAVTYGNGRMNVSAEGLPGKACVQVGWHLAKEGTIIVNGVLPMRLSAARLSELCSEREGGATLTWVPDEK